MRLVFTTVFMAKMLQCTAHVCPSVCLFVCLRLTTDAVSNAHSSIILAVEIIDLFPISSDEGSPCQNGGVRLVGGTRESEGRVEMCLGGEWGTVCADIHWDEEDAQTVCRQKGYDPEGNIPAEIEGRTYRLICPRPGSIPVFASGFGGGAGPIQLQRVDCEGDEEALVSCPLAAGFGFSLRCYAHTIDAGVICKGEGRGLVATTTWPQSAMHFLHNRSHL